MAEVRDVHLDMGAFSRAYIIYIYMYIYRDIKEKKESVKLLMRLSQGLVEVR